MLDKMITNLTNELQNATMDMAAPHHHVHVMKFTDVSFKVGQGHIYTGVVWFLLYTTHAWAAIHRYFKAEMSERNGWIPGFKYRSTVPFTCAWFGNQPIIGYLMATMGTILIANTAYGEKDKEFAAIHIGILSVIALYGLSEILYYHGFLTMKDWDYAAFSLLFFNIFIFIMIHFQGAHPNKEHMLMLEAHKYQPYIVSMSTIALIAEILYRNSMFPVLARCFAGICGSVWSVTLGIMYFRPEEMDAVDKTDEQIAEKITYFRNLFVWLILGVEFYIIFLLTIGNVRVRCLGAETPTYELRPKTSKIAEAKKGYSFQLDYQTVNHAELPSADMNVHGCEK